MNFLKILFPDRCPICDTARSLTESGICPDCQKKIKYVKEPVCRICGREAKYKGIVCEECKKNTPFYDSGKSLYAYSTVNSAMYRFKYMNRAPYGEAFAKEMTKAFGDWLMMLQPDALIPVPIHKKRLIKRGYNQATELADGISKLTGIPVDEDFVKRTKNTVPQKYMSKSERRTNMKKAFIVQRKVVNFKRVVIIDDIFTTGSTINELAYELKEAGVREVYFLTLSRAGI